MPDSRPLMQQLLSRRMLGFGALAVGAGLAGCAAPSGSTSAPAPVASGSVGSSSGFPATIDHAFGSTTIEQQPTKVASVGYTEQDFLLSLGITPIAVTDWYGEQPLCDVALGAAGSGRSHAEGAQLRRRQFLEVAKLKPDLIVGLNAGMEEGDYAKLAKIAPTIPHTKAGDAWFGAWPDILAPIALAVGKVTEGERVKAAVQQKFSDAAAAHPEFAGKKVVFLQNAVYDGSLIAYQKGLSTEFLTDLGFDVPSEIDAYVKEGEQAYIPVEKINVLNAADVLLWGTEKDEDRTALEKVPGFATLEAVKAGRSIYTGGELAGAIYFASPLSLPYVVDKLVPQLADAFQ